ncbi:hypothetical protein Tco_0021347, partial [Tanacetum coccineum]
MCKAYDGEPSVDFFRGVFDLFPGGDWLTFTKRPEADVPTIFLKPITRIEDRNGRFFYVQDTIVSSGHPANVQTFSDPILFFADEELQTNVDCYLSISNITPPVWRGHLDNQSEVELLDIHDRCYGRQAVVDNVVNQRARELLRMVDQMKGECRVLSERERLWIRSARNSKLSVKEHKSSMNKMMLESQKWAGYQENLMTLELKVVALEAEKSKLKVVEAHLRKEIKTMKCDRAEVVSKV